MYPKQVRRTGMRGEPTPAQVAYAIDISRMLDVDMPEEKTKQAYSDYINRYANKYKSAVQEWKLMQELECNMRNG